MSRATRMTGLFVAAVAASVMGAMGAGCDDNNCTTGSGGAGGRTGIGGQGGSGGSGSGGRGGVGGRGGEAGIGGVPGGTGGASGGTSGAGGRGASGGGGGRAGTGGVAGAGGTAGAAGGAAGAAGAGGAGGAAVSDLTDGQVAGVMIEANSGEISAGGIADSRAVSAAVRAFAAMMVNDHTTANQNLATVLQQAGITASDSPDRRSVAEDATDTAMMLWATTTAAFDLAYVQSQVTMHTTVLHLLDGRLIPSTQSQALKTELQMERSAVMIHLTAAQQLQAQLTGGAGGAGGAGAGGSGGAGGAGGRGGSAGTGTAAFVQR
jgi:predicted outer membrane protein